MLDLIGAAVAFAGTIFLLLATLALVRMPDLYGRLSATSKAVTLGASLVLAGAAIGTADPGVSARVLAGIAFLFLTSPIAAHVVARAGWRTAMEPVVDHQDEFETEPPALRARRLTTNAVPTIGAGPPGAPQTAEQDTDPNTENAR